MYFKIEDTKLIVKVNADSPDTVIPLDGFPAITSLCYHPCDHSILLSGSQAGVKPLKTVATSRLYRWRLDDPGWTELYKSECFRAVPSPHTKAIAIDTGFGVAVLDEAGQVKADCHHGRIRLSPREHSMSPDGEQIAFLHYRGDDKRLVVFDTARNEAVEYKPSWYSYGWFDNNHIIFDHSVSIRLLSLDTGKTSIFLDNLFKTPADQQAVAHTELAALFEPGSHIDLCSFNGVRIHKERAFFIAGISGVRRDQIGKTQKSALQVIYHLNLFKTRNTVWEFDSQVTTSYSCLFSCGKDARDLRLEYIGPLDHGIFDYAIGTDGDIVLTDVRYNNKARLVSSERVVIGDVDSLLRQGWNIMPDGSFVEGRYTPLVQRVDNRWI